MHRRAFIAASGATAAAAARNRAQPAAPGPAGTGPPAAAGAGLKGRLKQPACRWCDGSMPLEDLCRNAAAIGLKSIELLTEKEWSVPAKYGLTCAVAMGPTTIPRGFNRTENHDG